MEETNQVAGESSELSNDSVNNNVSEQSIQNQQQDNKYLSQSEVNTMIGAAKRKAYEKGLEEARNSFSSHQQSFPNHSQHTSSQAQSINQQNVNSTGLGNLTPEQIKELVNSQVSELTKKQQEEMQVRAYQQQASQVVAQLTAKCEEAKKDIQDFDDVMGTVNNFADAPGVAFAANNFDNAGEILYHLANNPREIAAIESLCDKMPGAAQRELKKIADRLKQNKNAKASPSSPSPLRAIESSNVGLGDGAPKSVSDWMSIYTT